LDRTGRNPRTGERGSCSCFRSSAHRSFIRILLEPGFDRLTLNVAGSTRLFQTATRFNDVFTQGAKGGGQPSLARLSTCSKRHIHETRYSVDPLDSGGELLLPPARCTDTCSMLP